MKKVIIYVIIGILASLSILFALLYFDIIKLAQEVEEPAQHNNLESVLELNFDTIDDINWFEETNEIFEAGSESEIVSDGKYSAEYGYCSSTLAYPIEENTICHMRVDLSASNNAQSLLTCFFNIRTNDEFPTGLFVDITPNNVLSFGAESPQGRKDYTVKGSAVLMQDGVVDLILYFGENNEMGVVASYLDSDKILYRAIKVPETWASDDWYFSFHSGHDGEYPVESADVDFIKVYRGDILDYLDAYIPAYQNHKSAVDKHFTGEITLVDEGQFRRHDESYDQNQEN